MRYGESHRGDAVLVFVTESMNPRLQVKADSPGRNDVPVLKLNFTRKFYTGIYPYSIMTSVFTPVDIAGYGLPLKISASFQEWCGQVYMQLNLRDGAYAVQAHSYFEKEADQNFRVDAVLSEDALWNIIRVAPSRLPRGRLEMLPAAIYARFKHQNLEPAPVEATLEAVAATSLEKNPLLRYELRYPQKRRTVVIFFERDFPHRIQGWEESEPQPGDATGVLTTRANRTHTVLVDYWNKHGNHDRRWLKKLGLSDSAN